MLESSASPDIDVLVVGAGPTGLTAALVLAQSGIDCRIVDKRPEPSGSSRALGLQARSMEVLAGLGVTDEIEEAAYRLGASSILRGRRRVARMEWVPPQSRFPHTYVLPQAGLEGILRRRLEDFGVTVGAGVEVTAVASDDDGVRADLLDGGSIRASWLIGADGARSAVRTAAGIGFPEHATGEVYHLADALLDLPIALDDGVMWLGPEGPLMLMRLPGDERLWRVFVDVTQHAIEEMEPLAAEALTELLNHRGPGGISVLEVQWSSIFRTRIGLADSYRRGRIFLAGDATHVFPPFGGQGMNLGIQDAVNLGWRLAAVVRGANSTLLHAYESERRSVAEAVISDVDARRRLFALRNPVARTARDALLAVGARSRRARRSASLQNSQLAISYRDRASGGKDGPFPRPGDRAPHAAIVGTTSHELFGPDHLTLLVFGTGHPPDVAPPGLEVITRHLDGSVESEVFQRYGFTPSDTGWVLVRPDGYVASRGDTLSSGSHDPVHVGRSGVDHGRGDDGAHR